MTNVQRYWVASDCTTLIENGLPVDYERNVHDKYVLASDYDALAAQLATAQARVAALESLDTSHLPYEKGWQDGRTDAWEVYQRLVAPMEASLATANERLRDLIAAGNAMTPFLSCTGAWVEDRSKHDCPGCKALTAWLAGSAKEGQS